MVAMVTFIRLIICEKLFYISKGMKKKLLRSKIQLQLLYVFKHI